jgi:hypothetical protein
MMDVLLPQALCTVFPLPGIFLDFWHGLFLYLLPDFFKCHFLNEAFPDQLKLYFYTPPASYSILTLH